MQFVDDAIQPVVVAISHIEQSTGFCIGGFARVQGRVNIGGDLRTQLQRIWSCSGRERGQ